MSLHGYHPDWLSVRGKIVHTNAAGFPRKLFAGMSSRVCRHSRSDQILDIRLSHIYFAAVSYILSYCPGKMSFQLATIADLLRPARTNIVPDLNMKCSTSMSFQVALNKPV